MPVSKNASVDGCTRTRSIADGGAGWRVETPGDAGAGQHRGKVRPVQAADEESSQPGKATVFGQAGRTGGWGGAVAAILAADVDMQETKAEEVLGSAAAAVILLWRLLIYLIYSC